MLVNYNSLDELQDIEFKRTIIINLIKELKELNESTNKQLNEVKEKVNGLNIWVMLKKSRKHKHKTDGND